MIFIQHPLRRRHARRRPVKGSVANTSLAQRVPESPISYHPSTVPSITFTQHPLQRRNARRRPVKRSAANASLPQCVPESP
ncbi:hypothetical protein K503DRAFT_765423, partial [Rhizopogon vinicolor AM-OR11-026]